MGLRCTERVRSEGWAESPRASPPTPQALDIGEQDLGFALVGAATDGAVACLVHLLRKADELGILTALCSDPSKFASSSWHLSIYEHALRAAVLK